MKNRQIIAKKIFIGLIILVLGILVSIAIVIYMSSISSPDPVGTTTLTESTQMRYGDVSIALSNVSKDSAWMYFRNNKTNASTKKQVKVGDMINIYSYSIKINSLEEIDSFSTSTGSSRSYVKFIIDKQK